MVSTFSHVQFYVAQLGVFFSREMALLRYLQLNDGLPDPTGALSLAIPSLAIAEANRDVQEETGAL